jgi:TonB family protein
LFTAWVTGVALAVPAAAAAQMDQPLPPPPEPTEPVRAPQVTKAPAIRKSVEPVYPPEALAEGLSGDVTLTIDIDADGLVTAVTVATPAGHGFDEAAVEAVKQMEFSPAEVDGKPSRIRISYTIHFQPKTVPEPALPPPAAPELPPPEPKPPETTGRVVVRGTIRERGTREPVVGANVAVIRRGTAPGGGDPPAVTEGSTDEDGRFEVRAASAGALSVIVSDAAHESCVRDFTAAELGGAAPAEWMCWSRARDAGLNETRVRAKPEHTEETKQTLTKTELTTVPGTVGDPLRVLQNMPGVARMPFGLGLLIVRGASPTDTGVFIGGAPIPVLYHFLAGPSVFTYNLIEKIDFYPGGFGVRYGRYIGGAVDVTVRGDVGRTLHGAVDVNLRDSSAFVEGPLGKGYRASFAVRRSYIDAILPLVLPLFVEPRVGSTYVSVAPVYWDYQGRVDKDLAGGGRLSLVTYGSSDALEVIASDPTLELTANSNIGFHHVMGEWLTTLPGGWASRLNAMYAYGNESVDTGVFGGFQRYHRMYGRHEVNKRFTPWIAMTAGLDVVLSYDWATFTNIPFPRDGRTLGPSMPPMTEIRRTLYNTAPAAYVEAQWNPHPRLRLVPGLRFDYYHVLDTDKYSWDPRLAVRWELTPRMALKVSAGVYHQLPTPEFLDREYGNPNLELPWSQQYQLGIERTFTEAINLTATAYYVSRHDLPVASVDHFSSTGRGRAYGLELLLRHHVTKHFYGWLAYTLSRAENAGALAEGVPMNLNGMARNGADLSWRLAQFDQPHSLIAVGSYRWANWEAGATFRLVSGRPNTPVAGSFLDADTGNYTRVNGPLRSTRHATYVQLDLRVERRFTFDKWVLGVYIDLLNALNIENAEGQLFDYRSRASAPLRGIPIFPVLGARGRF